MIYLVLWLRAFAIVTATAANVVFISSGNWAAAFVTGWIISALWYTNVNQAVRVPGGWFAYALGAGCGTVTGMTIGRLF
jgi:hypothetical protein